MAFYRKKFKKPSILKGDEASNKKERRDKKKLQTIFHLKLIHGLWYTSNLAIYLQTFFFLPDYSKIFDRIMIFSA